jgi:uncharacterized protein YegJ (DUF2314 family)
VRIAIRLSILVIVLVIGGILRYNRQHGQTVSPKGVPMVQAEANDPRLAQASAEARRRWPEFFAALKNPAGKTAFAVKHAFPLKRGSVEHMWVEVSAIDGNQVRGNLVDQPYGDIGLKEGDPVTLTPDQIEDWMYVDKDKTVGNFSQPVLEAIEAEQRK